MKQNKSQLNDNEEGSFNGSLYYQKNLIYVVNKIDPEIANCHIFYVINNYSNKFSQKIINYYFVKYYTIIMIIMKLLILAMIKMIFSGLIF